jgi:hypothetical protein
MIFLAVRMMSKTGNQLNLREANSVVQSMGHAHPIFLALDYRSWTRLGYAANGYKGGGRSIAVTRHV